MWADARLHASPNAGWPETAVAGSLGLALAGPRIYGGRLTDGAWLNAHGRRTATADDIRAACRLLWRAWAVLLTLAVVAAAVRMTVGGF
jgi:adenosylcobinamide-phosphate synthase